MASRKAAGKTRTGRNRTAPAAKRKAARRRTAKATPPDAGAGRVVKDSNRAPPHGARRVGGIADREKIIEVTLTLRGPDLPTADELGSPTFSTRRFAARFSASRRDVDKVSQVLR